jgi:hypothetical protein
VVSTWTKTPPTEPGAYWFRNKELSKFLCDYDSDEIEILKTRTIKGEWCGPLVPAEEVEKAFYEGHVCAFCSDPDLDPARFNYGNSRAKQVAEGKL